MAQWNRGVYIIKEVQGHEFKSPQGCKKDKSHQIQSKNTFIIYNICCLISSYEAFLKKAAALILKQLKDSLKSGKKWSWLFTCMLAQFTNLYFNLLNYRREVKSSFSNLLLD